MTNTTNRALPLHPALWLAAAAVALGVLAGCGRYGPPKRPSAIGRLEAPSARGPAVEAGPVDDECEEEDAAKKNP